MGKFSNYVIILRQIGPLHYYIEKGSANIKVRPINYTTHFNIQLFHSITFNIVSNHIISYHVVKNVKGKPWCTCKLKWLPSELKKWQFCLFVSLVQVCPELSSSSFWLRSSSCSHLSFRPLTKILLSFLRVYTRKLSILYKVCHYAPGIVVDVSGGAWKKKKNIFFSRKIPNYCLVW